MRTDRLTRNDDKHAPVGTAIADLPFVLDEAHRRFQAPGRL